MDLVGLKILSNKVKNNILNKNTISGGEKKRIELTRALVNKVKIIIFDEPTSGLDPKSAQVIEKLIFSLNDLTRIVITHNQDENYLERFDGILNIENFK
nr:ATP-binding cassette domain-containing protein [Anaerococcus faecalis]